MTGAGPTPLTAASFLVVAMSTAGIAHVAWLKSRFAQRFAVPIDAGRNVRGRRLFGENKMLRGFVVMPIAAALAFAAWAAAWPTLGMRSLWPLSLGEFAALGLACGFAFMAAELPNSLIKRQLGIEPGMTPTQPAMRALFFVVDRCDSVLGALLVASVAVPLPPAAWFWTLVLGPCMHAVFSILLHRLGVKRRAL